MKIAKPSEIVCEEEFSCPALDSTSRTSGPAWCRFFHNLRELMCEIGQDSTYTYVSPGYEQRLGYSVGELLGTNAQDIVHPDDLEDLRQLLRQHEAPGDVFRSSSRFRGKAGNWYWFDWTSERVRKESGELRTLVCGLDVTEQREADLRFRNLVAAAPDALIMVDRDGRIVLFNAAAEALFGYSSEEVVNEPVEVLVPHRHRSTHAERRQRFFRDRANRVVGIRSPIFGLRREGTEIPVEISLSSVGGKSEPFVVASVRDASERSLVEDERRSQEERMHHSQKLESLGMLAGGIAHDFNNMLGAIMNYSNIALSQMRGERLPEEALEGTKEAVSRMAGLCNQLLDYAGRGESAIGPVNLSDEVGGLASLIESSVSRMAEVRYDLGRELPTILSDPSQIHQVLLNLVINASDSLEGGPGVINIRTGVRELDEELRSRLYLDDVPLDRPYVYLEVSDSGCGMESETQGRLFDPFFTSKAGGRGLGMAVVLGIVRRNAGTIAVRSRPGSGTSITVLFPPATDSESAHPRKAATDSESAHPRKAATGGSDPAARQGTILLVEDEDALRNSGALLLRSAGYTVLTAGDGAEAVELFAQRSEKVDLVIMDLAMPRMGGEDAIREIRRIRPGVHMLVTSGYADVEVMERFGTTEPPCFLQKPYEIKTLFERINALIGATA